MAKAASRRLGELHGLFAEYLRKILEEAAGEGEDALPLDAATMGVIRTFLKDNDITADPSNADDLAELRARLSEENKRHRQKSNVLNMVAEATEDGKVH